MYGLKQQDINKLKVIIPNEFENESKKIPYRKIKKYYKDLLIF